MPRVYMDAMNLTLPTSYLPTYLGRCSAINPVPEAGRLLDHLLVYCVLSSGFTFWKDDFFLPTRLCGLMNNGHFAFFSPG